MRSYIMDQNHSNFGSYIRDQRAYLLSLIRLRMLTMLVKLHNITNTFLSICIYSYHSFLTCLVGSIENLRKS